MRRKRFVGECYGYATTTDRREVRLALERLAVQKPAFERRIVVAYLHAFHWSEFRFLLVFLNTKRLRSTFVKSRSFNNVHYMQHIPISHPITTTEQCEPRKHVRENKHVPKTRRAECGPVERVITIYTYNNNVYNIFILYTMAVTVINGDNNTRWIRFLDYFVPHAERCTCYLYNHHIQ